MIDHLNETSFLGIIAKLLEEKWTTFANLIFTKRLIIHIVHLICISFAVYSRPPADVSLLNGIRSDTGDITATDITRYCFEIATILGK